MNVASPEEMRYPMRYHEDDSFPIINYNYNCVNDFSPNKSNGPVLENNVPIKSSKSTKKRDKSKPKKKTKNSKNDEKKPVKKSNSNRRAKTYQSDYESSNRDFRETRSRGVPLDSVESHSDIENISNVGSIDNHRRPVLRSVENFSRDSSSVKNSPNLRKENSWKKRKSTEPLRRSLENSSKRLPKNKKAETNVIPTQTVDEEKRPAHVWEEHPIGGSSFSPPKEKDKGKLNRSRSNSERIPKRMASQVSPEEPIRKDPNDDRP